MTNKKVLTNDEQKRIDELYNNVTTFMLTRKQLDEHNLVSKHIAHLRCMLGWEINEKIIKK